MSFKEMVAADIHNVFLNMHEFADRRTVRYDGEQYEDIPVVLLGLTMKDRPQLSHDHGQGLYLASDILYCALDDLDGNQPEKGMRLRVNDREGGGGFFREFYVASSSNEMGMLRVELEAIDE